MTTSALKTALHETIENINDAELLKTLSEISSHHYSIVQDPELTEYELNRLNESKKQIAVGNFYTNEQANELMKKWLNK